MRKAGCHPNRKYRALGLCNACYLQQNGGSKRWYQRNKKLTIKRSIKWNEENIKARKHILRTYSRNLKIEVLTYYGKGNKLKCCWRNCQIVDIDMLTLDHINNDGAIFRKENGPGYSSYCKVRRGNFPRGFQTLCRNHQWKKEIARRRKNRK